MTVNGASISRRKFLKGTAIAGGGIAATGLAAPAVLAQAPIVIRMQSSWAASDVFMDMAREYIARVEAMSNHRLQIDLQPAGAIVGAFAVMDAVSDGVIDATHTVPVYWYGKHKAASLFGTGPVFGGSAMTMLAWYHRGGGKEFYQELTRDVMGLNIRQFYGFPMPQQPFGWFKNPVNTVADIAGLKYRTVGLAADLMQAMGMSVAQLPGGEIVPAMERGVIDAFEFNNPTADRRFGAADVAKNYYMGSFHQASESFEIVYNGDFFDDLDEDLQAILEYGVDAASASNSYSALNYYSADLQGLITEDGVTVRKTPAAVLESQVAAWDQLIPSLEADPFIKRVLDSQREWVRRVVFFEQMATADLSIAYKHYFPGVLPA